MRTLLKNRTLNIRRERGNCLAGRILGIERGRAVKQERRDLTVLEKSSDTFEELKYRSVKHKVVSLYICKNRTLHILKDRSESYWK